MPVDVRVHLRPLVLESVVRGVETMADVALLNLLVLPQ
jgi:hypothetical protein